jgi:hypothetical protein
MLDLLDLDVPLKLSLKHPLLRWRPCAQGRSALQGYAFIILFLILSFFFVFLLGMHGHPQSYVFLFFFLQHISAPLENHAPLFKVNNIDIFTIIGYTIIIDNNERYFRIRRYRESFMFTEEGV